MFIKDAKTLIQTCGLVDLKKVIVIVKSQSNFIIFARY